MATDDAAGRGARGRGAAQVDAAPLQVERVQPSYVQVATQLRALILAGQVAPGERLPAEAELSARFGVSRSTTREALRLLAAEKLVETRRGVTGGTFVTHPDPRDIEIALSTSVNLAASTGLLTNEDVFEVWRLTQPHAARLAARRRTDEQADGIVRLGRPAAATEGAAELTLRAIDFHRAILDASGNRLLEILTRPLSGLGAATVEERPDALAFLAAVQLRHGTIAAAIHDRDEDRAYELMAADMEAPSHAPEADGRPKGPAGH